MRSTDNEECCLVAICGFDIFRLHGLRLNNSIKNQVNIMTISFSCQLVVFISLLKLVFVLTL